MTDIEKKTAANKANELVEAARKRREIEQANTAQQPKAAEQRFDENELEVLKDDAEIMAEGKVQAKAGPMDGTIDVEAMGDVKGDGGDAKDYDDGDPDKALGVPTYLHGLHETREGVDTITATENSISSRTRAEQERGRQLVEERQRDREKAQRQAERQAKDEADNERRVTGKTTVEELTDEDKAKLAKKQAAEAKKAEAKK